MPFESFFDRRSLTKERKNDIKYAKEDLSICISLYDCTENDIPTFANESGLKNFEKVINRAEGLPVKIAFENTEGEKYLATIMKCFSHYDHIGFCWDTGHENDVYAKMPIQEYLIEAYKRACRVAALKLQREIKKEDFDERP